MRYGIVENGKLANFGESDDPIYAAANGWKELNGDEKIGWLWTEGGLVAPPAPPYDRAGACKKIDDNVAAIYVRFTRFDVEYYERETQAQAFKDANYEGDVPARVQEFATPAGLAANVATDLILSQAAALRDAMAQLSALRMRKYEVTRAVTDELAEATAEVILATIAYIGNNVS